jgi:hypothetical protein
MNAFNLFFAGIILALIPGCLSPDQSPSRDPIAPPEIVNVPLGDDSTAFTGGSGVFYTYQFGSRENDMRMSPEWAVSNLYNAGIRVAEAWYVSDTRPASHKLFATGTIYGPALVVGLKEEDDYILKYRYNRLDTFNPIEMQRAYLHTVEHYLCK